MTTILLPLLLLIASICEVSFAPVPGVPNGNGGGVPQVHHSQNYLPPAVSNHHLHPTAGGVIGGFKEPWLHNHNNDNKNENKESEKFAAPHNIDGKKVPAAAKIPVPAPAVTAIDGGLPHADFPSQLTNNKYAPLLTLPGSANEPGPNNVKNRAKKERKNRKLLAQREADEEQWARYEQQQSAHQRKAEEEADNEEEWEEEEENDDSFIGHKAKAWAILAMTFPFGPTHMAVAPLMSNVHWNTSTSSTGGGVRSQGVRSLENLHCQQHGEDGQWHCKVPLPADLVANKQQEWAIYTDIPAPHGSSAKNLSSVNPQNMVKVGQLGKGQMAKCAVKKPNKAMKTVEKTTQCKVEVKADSVEEMYKLENQIRPMGWREYLFVHPFREMGKYAQQNGTKKEEEYTVHRKLLQAPGSAPTFTIVNQCEWPVFTGILTGDTRYARPAQGGLGKLNTGESAQFAVPADLAALRIWPRLGCNDNGQQCSSGQCGGDGIHCQGTGGVPPVSLQEFTFSSTGVFYDNSLVDGFDIPVEVKPVNGQGEKCQIIKGCELRDLTDLPGAMKVKNADGATYLVRSQCLGAQVEAGSNPTAEQKLKVNKACCNQQYTDVAGYGTPDLCHPVYQGEEPFESIYNTMNARCSQSYLYAYNDDKATFICQPGAASSFVNFEITYCPAPAQ